MSFGLSKVGGVKGSEEPGGSDDRPGSEESGGKEDGGQQPSDGQGQGKAGEERE